MATVKSDDNTPGDHDRSDSSSEVDPTLGKRQKLEEAESKNEESQGFNDEKESNPIVEGLDKESDEKLDDEKESNPIVELDDEKESNPIVEVPGEESIPIVELDDEESDDEKESNPIVELDDEESDDEKQNNPIVELDDDELDDDELDDEELDDEKESNPIVELDDEDDSSDEDVTIHLRAEEEFVIEDRQKQLAEAAKQGREEASSSSSSKPLPILFIHHSEGDLFEKRAQEVKKALEDKIPGIHIHVNNRTKYKLGIFYIRSEEQDEYIALQMEPPFTELVNLDIDNLAWEISMFYN